MRKKIFKSIAVVAIMVFVACVGLFMNVQYDYFTAQMRKQLLTQVKIIADSIENNGVDYLSQMQDTNTEIYLVNGNNNIIYPSGINLKSDKSLSEYLYSGVDKQQNIKIYSKSFFENDIICSESIDNEYIVILRTSQSSLLKILLELTYPVILILLTAILLSVILSYKVTKKIVEPLNEINLDNPLFDKNYEELSPMLQKIEKQKIKLQKQEIELKYKRDEFEIVTENLSDGLILVNANGDILSINKAASDILKINRQYRKNIEDINLSPEFYDLIKKAYNGSKDESVIDITDGKYQVDVSPVQSNNAVAGVVVLILDVTEKEKSEKMRREFSANVSHELKTPLQSISGYAELLQHNLVKPDDIASFGGKIYFEAQRMIQLVEDIIHLSSLDEGAGEMTYSKVDLLKIALDTEERLRHESEIMNVTVDVSGEKTEITAIPRLISGIIFNLCDNAIKYNKKGGLVKINVTKDDKYAKVIVSDTGIGIPENDFARIFERFYRVDKSHSKEVGGTGLGLSIVKHAAIIHNAKIDLDSTVGIGTTITVSFPY